ncbi:MAG: hypothetical protein U1D30_22800 [Planctomycetota bacterium]
MIASVVDPFRSFGSVAINNKGDYAFAALLDSGISGIFTGTDPVLDKVIGIGDALDGSTVTHIAFQGSGFNDRGQIAFYADLANGRQGVYIASVPEAGSLVMLGAASAAALTLSARRRRNAITR